MSGDHSFRNKIIYAGFILSILVIWVHAVNVSFFGVDSSLQKIIGTDIGQIAVPGFFMLSSYLFFRNFDLTETLYKYKRRFYSVLLPYLIWNAIYYIGYIIAGRAAFDIPTVLKAVFMYAYNPVFWYMQQLIALIVLSPLIYMVIKRVWSAILLLILLAVLVFYDVRLYVINPDAMFYYSVAGIAAVHLHDVTESEGSLVESLIGLVLIALGAGCIFLAGLTSQSIFIVFMRTLCPIGLWCLIPAGILPDARSWMKNSFLVYALHFALLKGINYAGAWLLPHTVVTADILYLVAPAIIIAVVCLISYLLRRFVPKLYDVLSGRR